MKTSTLSSLVFCLTQLILLINLAHSQQIANTTSSANTVMPISKPVTISNIKGDVFLKNVNGELAPITSDYLIQPGMSLWIRKGGAFTIGNDTIGFTSSDSVVLFPQAGSGTVFSVGASGPIQPFVIQQPFDLMLEPIENWKVRLITARTVPRIDEVRDISDKFNFEGRIHAHITLTSPPGTQSGRQFFEIKWFHENILSSTQKAVYVVNKTPFYLSSSTSGTALGAGRCKVELWANGRILALHEFDVASK
jgi:hypothetical protein